MSLKYRAEIDGLRAIAVVAVVLYHAKFLISGIDPFRGGFIGVDIFFVISGYLIASIIIKQFENHSFSYLYFYERRARRILPALFTVMIASIPFSWGLMLPKAMKEYSGSILSSLAFSSNIWFWSEDSYWAEPSALKPFLHTWSLSVEEQFYFIFPVLLFVLVKFGRKAMLPAFYITFIASLIIAHIGSIKYADAAFYLLPTRWWEIAAGAIMAKIELDKGRPTNPLLNSTLPVLGLIMVCSSIYIFKDGMRHPSLYTLLPIIGTMLLIWYCQKGGLVTRLLSSKPFVGIGLISYGFYLWHFPVFSYALIHFGEISDISKILLIILSIVLSVITYYAVEKPARNRELLKTKTFYIILLLPFLCLIFLQSFLYKTDGAEFRLDRFSEMVEMNYWSDEKGYKNLFWTHDGCWLTKEAYIQDNPFNQCKSNESLNTSGLIMVIGDSNVASLIPGLIDRFGRDSIAQRVVNACFPARVTGDPFCDNSMDSILQDINQLNPSLIIMGGRYMTSQNSYQLKELITKDLMPYKDKIVIFGPLPRWGDLPEKLLGLFKNDPLNFEVPTHLTPLPNTFWLDEMAEKTALDLGVTYMSAVKSFCSGKKCLVKVGEEATDITAWDYGHLTHNASKYLVNDNFELLSKFTKKEN